MTLIEDFQYPIGQLGSREDFSAVDRVGFIEVLRQLPGNLQAAVLGLTDVQLDTPYRDGGWTVRQLVHHIADSHANSYIRFKLALTEDWPTIKAYEQDAWASLPDSKMPIQVSLEMVSAVHARWVVLLEAMSPEQFAVGFTHPVYGRLTLAQALAMYDWHSRHHTAHITQLRRRMGW